MATTSIVKATLIRNIWRNFFDRMQDQITTVTLTDASIQTVQNYAAQFSDITFNKKADYPVLVVNTPTISHEYFSLGTTLVDGTIDIEIYTTNAESADRYLDAINEAIETYKGDLRNVGMRFVDLVGVDVDMFERGKIKVHRRTVTWKFDFRFSKTLAF